MKSRNTNIKTAIIPVAGMGTRLLPITKAIPKELLPIYDRPAVQHIAEEAIEAGIEKIIFVIHPEKEAIRHHFTHNPKLKEQLLEKKKDSIVDHFDWLENVVEFDFAYQDEALGDGHAILQAVQKLNNEPVVVLFGDDIVDNPQGKNAGRTNDGKIRTKPVSDHFIARSSNGRNLSLRYCGGGRQPPHS